MKRLDSQPTILAVAQHAGVSPATVSRVLNDTAPVNEVTRTRVLEAMEALGYKPVVSATSKRQSSTPTVALLITDILNPFFPELVRGVEDEAGINDFNLVLYNTDEDTNREKQILARLAAQRPEGVIVCASRLPYENIIELRERYGIPLVVINRVIDHPEIPCVVVDLEDAAYRATQHLLSLNHRKIAYLAGWGRTETSRTRRGGVEKALAEYGLTLPEEWCPTSFPSVEGGFQAMTALFSQSRTERPTAVIAFNDIMALGCIHAIRVHHLSVPDDISVLGFDGIPLAAHANPPLTTVEQPKYRMGKIAMQMLRHMIQEQYLPGSGYTMMESSLIVRESTAPANG
jgi:DNA-binding LacI/PurR family transcriptional regulator